MGMGQPGMLKQYVVEKQLSQSKKKLREKVTSVAAVFLDSFPVAVLVWVLV